MVSNLMAFNLTEIGVIKDEVILSIALYEGYILTGNDKGLIALYETNNEKKKIEQRRSHCIKDKKPIDQLLCSPCSNILYVLSKGIVYIHTIPNMEQILSQPKDSVLKIVVNQHPDYQNYLLLITKKKKIKMVSIDFGEKKFIEENQKLDKKEKKDISVEVDPEIYEWYGELFCYSVMNKVVWVNVRTGVTFVQTLDRVQNMKYIQDGWLVLSDGIGLFMSTSGVMSISSVYFDPQPMINYYGYKNYIIALHTKMAEIMGTTPTGDTAQVQVLDIGDDKSVAKYFLKSQNRMILVAMNAQNVYKFWLLEEVSFETQIGFLLDSNKIDEAIIKLNDNVPSLDDRKPERMEQFFIDCAWTHIKFDDFDLAFRYAHLTHFNPFEFMYLYHEALEIKIIHPDSAKIIQNTYLADKLKKKSDDSLKKIYKLLINLLAKKRDFILRTYDLTKDMKLEMEFITSKKAIIDLSKHPMKLTVGQVFYYVNIALLKAMIKNQDEDPKKIAEIISHPSFTTKSPDDPEYDFADELLGKVKSNVFVDQREVQVARAYYYEKMKMYSEALDIWEKKFSHANNKTYLTVARERTKAMLLEISTAKTDRENNKKLLLKNLQWMLLDDGGAVNAFEIVTICDLFSKDYFISEVITKIEKEYALQNPKKTGTGTDGESSISSTPSKSEPTLNLKLKFLEYLNQKGIEEKYQTALVETYIDDVLKGLKDPSPNMTEKEKRQYFVDKEKYLSSSKSYKALLEFIHRDGVSFNKMLILDKVKNKLLDIELFLSSALNIHRGALERILNEEVDDERKMFEQIEKFCSDNVKKKPDIYSDLFIILSDQCKNITRNILGVDSKIEEIKKKLGKSTEDMKEEDALKNQKSKLEKKLSSIEEEMLKVMITFGDFEKLDPVFVLSKIPDNWNAIGDNLKLYISTVMKNYAHLVNKYKNGKSLSEMALLYKEREALQVKNKSVTIENDTNCEFCGKKIGNTIFVVYPNMKIYHSKCATNPSICPTTGVDFTKKKLVN